MSRTNEAGRLCGIRNQFRWSLQALACDADVQLTLFPDFVPKTEELALDYDHWFEVARSQLAGELATEQLEALWAIHARLKAISFGGPEFDGGLWSDEALKVRAQWVEIRAMARFASARLGWSIEPPPKGRAFYSFE